MLLEERLLGMALVHAAAKILLVLSLSSVHVAVSGDRDLERSYSNLPDRVWDKARQRLARGTEGIKVTRPGGSPSHGTANKQLGAILENREQRLSIRASPRRISRLGLPTKPKAEPKILSAAALILVAGFVSWRLANVFALCLGRHGESNQVGAARRVLSESRQEAAGELCSLLDEPGPAPLPYEKVETRTPSHAALPAGHLASAWRNHRLLVVGLLSLLAVALVGIIVGTTVPQSSEVAAPAADRQAAAKTLKSAKDSGAVASPSAGPIAREATEDKTWQGAEDTSQTTAGNTSQVTTPSTSPTTASSSSQTMTPTATETAALTTFQTTTPTTQSAAPASSQSTARVTSLTTPRSRSVRVSFDCPSASPRFCKVLLPNGNGGKASFITVGGGQAPQTSVLILSPPGINNGTDISGFLQTVGQAVVENWEKNGLKPEYKNTTVVDLSLPSGAPADVFEVNN